MSNPYDDYDFPADDPTAIGDGIYYDGGLYGPTGGPDTNPDDDEK
ncbi:hypothetical protein [Streptomyces eurythermus]